MILSHKLYLSILLSVLLSACSILKKDKKEGATPVESNMEAKVDSSSLVDAVIDSVEVIVPPAPPKEPMEYMTIDEIAMIDEINLLRGDPNAYIYWVDQYIQEFINESLWDAETKREEVAAANELIAELRNMEPRLPLRAQEDLYNVAVLHGEDMKEMKEVTHIGTNGLHPYQRIQDSTALDGSENLVGGGKSVRESVIMLLVDAGISNRGHRKNILNPRWEYVVCRWVGNVGEMNDTWIQLFAFTDPRAAEEANKPKVTRQIDPSTITETGTDTGSKTDLSTPLETPVSVPGDYSFMNTEEKAMIDEINLMRSNPKGYLPFVEAYAASGQGASASPFFAEAVAELKQQLSLLGKLSTLKPSKKLYEVAKAHGLDNKNNHQLEHTGTDGSDPFDRVKRSGLKNHIDDRGYFSPNENLVGGETTVRRSVIMLLVDAGIPNRGHRRALIDPNWEYVACYQIGKIENMPELRGSSNDDMDNCWVQLFAKD